MNRHVGGPSDADPRSWLAGYTPFQVVHNSLPHFQVAALVGTMTQLFYTLPSVLKAAHLILNIEPQAVHAVAARTACDLTLLSW